MAGKNRKRELDERLDRLGREVLRAAAVDDEAAEAASASPFLYARVRSRIAAERERREAGENWLTLLSVVWRSAPAMALVAVFAVVMFWLAIPATRSPGVLSDEALLGESGAGIEQVVFADRSSLSNDEVLATILVEDEREAAR